MSAPEKLPPYFWLTRDEPFPGEISSRVDIWAIAPVRTELVGGGWTWLAPEDKDVDAEDTCLGDWSIADARLQVGNGIPDTSRECIVVGHPPNEPKRVAS